MFEGIWLHLLFSVTFHMPMHEIWKAATAAAAAAAAARAAAAAEGKIVAKQESTC